MRAAGAARMTSAPTATLPGISLYSVASRPLYVYEVEIYNTTAVACEVALVRLTTAGTVGAAVTVEGPFDSDEALDGAMFQAHSSTPPTFTTVFRQAMLGAAIGAGAIWTFDAQPIRIPAGTANGVGILCLNGTGQICDVSFDWDQ